MDSEVLIEAVGEEDEEFDWEAAVREIDLACQKSSNPSVSFPLFSSFHSSSSHLPAADDASIVKNNLGGHPYGNVCNPLASKQSTLDKFFERPVPRAPPVNQTVSNQSEIEFVDGDDKIPCPNIDLEAANTWIYPVNVPLRDYQFAITKTALFSNTLVALPTGLGKTLIAAVVMYNYFRWFPEGKIVFAAPSRPLVMQQIEACHNIVGIPQEWTIDMTGQTSPSKRALLWKNKRVFFVTPQVLEKDIQSGTCLVNYLVCLVIDEAHRALGNYSYCVAVRELMAVPVQMRILALTATPGSKTQAIQGIIDNLQISTLEYRNESDHDVSPYVHNRKVELIEVPLGQDVVEINKRLLDVIRPYAARLSSLGLLQNRDYQTLSPCDLLISRDKFRQAPSPGLPHVNHGDVESCFAALITLYHIRKLLSSHGIRPAYEMLEEKLRQGSFARLMSKNEDIRKAKLLMQQSLSHGAPSPKLSKMLEVLVDHFNTKDPKASRVIVFSNFRGSVRDIMNALSNIGDVVKATEFIGQSSGKALKGQSQKVQQAVLEKFRAGGYNVIVATSIGEEGLDIMEVDLVICFDANISPLRMIQRMGRTGRKHDGRVVVLACEGSELKGYMRKQANGRSIRKHMRNGGMNSFNFHPSPRMIPHVFKPEVQFVELSIKQFIPRGKKLKDENTPPFRKKLTHAEIDLLAEYFSRDREDTWRPSLIAFPHFQALPSKVNKVMHSHRTRMFIDAMQHLQEATFPENSKSFFTKMQDTAPLSEREGVDTSLCVDNDAKDLPCFDDVQDNISQRIVKDPAVSPTSTLKTTGKDHVSELCPEEYMPKHRYLFGSEFASVDALGKVFIMPVPSLSSYVPDLKCTILTKTVFLDTHEEQSCLPERPNKFHSEPIIQASKERHLRGDTLASPSCKFKHGKSPNTIEKIVGTQTMGKDLSGEEGTKDEAIDYVEIRVLSDEADLEDVDLSPRLTNFIESGVVPESPVNDQRIIEEKSGEENVVPKLSSPARFNDDAIPVNSRTGRRHNESKDCRALNTFTINDVQTPEKEKNFTSKRDCTVASPVPEEWRTPLTNLTNSSAIKDWQSSSREKPENVGQARKFKRLRKAGDCTRNCNTKTVKETSTNPVLNLTGSRSRTSSIRKRHVGGKSKRVDDVKVFIDEEAEVSSEAEISADEKDELGDNSYDDSFIDDRTNPTASTQAESSKVDMMAIYRRSLLSQSPLPRRLLDLGASSSSPDSVGPMTKMCESRSSSDKSLCPLQTPPTNSTDKSAQKSSILSHTNQDRTITTGVASLTAASDVSREEETTTESRKRKFGSNKAGYIPMINLEKEFALQAEIMEREEESLQQQPSERNRGNAAIEADMLDDDDAFYETLDFDAVEAQATLLLKQKPRASSELKTQETTEVLLSNMQSNGLENNAPSFDLGL